MKALCREAGAVVKIVSRKKLDELLPEVNHQGVVAVCACVAYASVEDILAVSRAKGTMPFLIIADEIEDPHNLGAILRTAEAAGAAGVIIPKRRSASLTAAVYKTSAGAVSYTHLDVYKRQQYHPLTLSSCARSSKRRFPTL